MRTINDIVRASAVKSGYNARLHADVAKLVDAPDLGSGVAIREGSSPFIRTTFLNLLIYQTPAKPASYLCKISAIEEAFTPINHSLVNLAKATSSRVPND
jgi:hypothetical protein